MLTNCDFAVFSLKKSKLKTKVSVLQKQDTDFDLLYLLYHHFDIYAIDFKRIMTFFLLFYFEF